MANFAACQIPKVHAAIYPLPWAADALVAGKASSSKIRWDLISQEHLR